MKPLLFFSFLPENLSSCRRLVYGYYFSPNNNFFPYNNFQVQMKIAEKNTEEKNRFIHSGMAGHVLTKLSSHLADQWSWYKRA